MRATINSEKKESKRQYLIPLIILISSICFESFFGNYLFYYSHESIISVQNFLCNKLKISLFNNTIDSIPKTTQNDSSSDNPIEDFISQVNGEIIFSEAFHFFNTNFCYLILCALLYNFVNVYKIFVLVNTIFLSNFISSTLCFIFHSPKPYMVYYSIKPIILFTDLGSPNSQVVTLIGFFLCLYKIIINNKVMKNKIMGKIILLCIIIGIIVLDIFLLFASGNIAYNQIIFSICVGIVTYQILFLIFKAEVNESKQLFNYLQFKITYYIVINFFLLLFQMILNYYVIDKSDEYYFKNNINIQQKRLPYSNFLKNHFNYRLYFYLNKGTFCDVICFLMNLVSFIALKAEIKITFKGNYNDWSESNFEKPRESLDNNNKGSFSGLYIINGTQWNHNGCFKGIIRLILIVILCLICLVPSILVYYLIESSETNGYIFIMTLPLVLLTFGIFYSFKVIFRILKLAKKSY